MSDIEIIKRLYHTYTKKHLGKILISVFFTLLVGSGGNSLASAPGNFPPQEFRVIIIENNKIIENKLFFIIILVIYMHGQEIIS